MQQGERSSASRPETIGGPLATPDGAEGGTQSLGPLLDLAGLECRVRHDVDHSPRAVQALERDQRAARAAILAVVVVLEDSRAGAARRLEERASRRFKLLVTPNGYWWEGVT